MPTSATVLCMLTFITYFLLYLIWWHFVLFRVWCSGLRWIRCQLGCSGLCVLSTTRLLSFHWVRFGRGRPLSCFSRYVIMSWRVVVWSRVGVVVRIMQYYVWWEALYNPLVLKSFIRSKSFVWIPLETSTDEIDEWWVWKLPELAHDVS